MIPPKPARLLMVGLLLLAVLGLPSQGQETAEPYVVVLGTAQDAGFPQAGCRRRCCAGPWADPDRRRLVSSLAIVDPASSQRWIVDATPDFREQLHRLDGICPVEASPGLAGILLTHGHMGHYTGLLHLGREVMGARAVPLLVMPRMERFLRGNGPWSQLVDLENVSLVSLEAGKVVPLNERIRVTPIVVPHRDEFTETVGYRIEGPNRSVLYLPDIDKWERWSTPIEGVIATVDLAYLDGTFFDGEELPGRDMAEIPHPFIVESLDRFGDLDPGERGKIRFLHLNHTNPALDSTSEATRRVVAEGMAIAQEGEVEGL